MAPRLINSKKIQLVKDLIVPIVELLVASKDEKEFSIPLLNA
jgi:hypothetical protein